MIILIFALFPAIISMVQYMHDKVIADKARTGKNQHLIELNLSGAFLADAKLSKAKLNKAILNDAKLQNADLKDANMVETSLTGAELNLADLSGANLMGADFSNCNLFLVNLSGSKSVKVQFTGAIMDSVNFSGADLSKAEMQKYLFNCDEISENNNDFKQFIKQFLRKKFNISCVPRIQIEKHNNGKIIRIDTKIKHISLKFNDKTMKIELEIDDKIIDEFIVKTKNGMFSIYESNTIRNCNLNGAKLSNINMEGIIFEDSDLNGTDFSPPINLEDAEFKNICLFNWDEYLGKINEKLIEFLKQEFDIDYVKKTKIEKIDNGRAIRLCYIKGIENKYLLLELDREKHKVNLKIDEIIIYEFIVRTEKDKIYIYKNIRTNLKYANLKNINLSGANLKYVDLTGADLGNAVLNGADLSYAILRDAKLKGTQMYGAKIFGAVFDSNFHGNFKKYAELGLSERGITEEVYLDSKLGEVDWKEQDLSDLYQEPIEPLYLFNWDEFPENCERLFSFLERKYKIDWLQSAKKECNSRKIDIYDESQHILLTFHKNQLKVDLKIDDVLLDEFFILVKNSYLFSWDEIPGNNDERFIEFLKDELKIEWAKTENISKIDDGKTIIVSNKEKSLSLKLNDEKKKVNLKINDGRVDEFTVKTENGKLNIYENSNRNVYTHFNYHGSSFDNSNFSGANLSESKLSGCVLTKSNLRETILKKAELNGSEMIEVDLTLSNLIEAELNGADLSSAFLIGADLSGAHLNGAKLDNAIMCTTDSNNIICKHNLKGANLRKAELNGASLINAKLMGADLSEATLSGTNLEGANLRGADLRGTDFCGANLENADFRDTIQDDNTNFGGTVHSPSN